MKPYLLLSTRPEDEAASGEHAAVAKFGKLPASDLVQIRVEQAPLPRLKLSDYSGIILGGGPYNASDQNKSETQLRVESDLDKVLGEVIARDYPFLGLCYGVGTVTVHLDGQVDRRYGEPVGAVELEVTPKGREEPLLAGVPERFRAFVGHKEAVTKLPSKAQLLVSGTACPVQMYRVAANCFVTQFHPELDAPGIAQRIQIYKHAGYFDPDETQALIAETGAANISPEVHSIVANFVARYAS